MTSWTQPSPAEPHHYPLEYPDIAGYPDGTGTLDEGTRTRQDAGADVAEFEEFLEGDNRDS